MLLAIKIIIAIVMSIDITVSCFVRGIIEIKDDIECIGHVLELTSIRIMALLYIAQVQSITPGFVGLVVAYLVAELIAGVRAIAR